MKSKIDINIQEKGIKKEIENSFIPQPIGMSAIRRCVYVSAMMITWQ